MNALWVSNTLAGKVTYRAFCEPRSLRRPLLFPRAPRGMPTPDAISRSPITGKRAP
jgi:hypothetical protein